MLKKRWKLSVLFLLSLVPEIGCKGLSVTEVRGRSAFGPEFRNFGNNTSDVRYTAVQGFDLKWSNDWTTGALYQRRDLDDGAGDNENLVLFEVGYPLGKVPKRTEKTAQQIELEKLHGELRELNSELAAAENANPGATTPRPENRIDRRTSGEKGE